MARNLSKNYIVIRKSDNMRGVASQYEIRDNTMYIYVIWDNNEEYWISASETKVMLL